MQRHAAGAVVVHLEPALGHDAARAVVQLAQGLGDAFAGQDVALGGFDHGRGLVGRVGEEGDGAKALLAVVALGRIQHHIAAREAPLHLAHLFGFDVEVARDDIDLVVGERLAVGVAVQCVRAEALFLGAQVEEQLALGLGGRGFDHAPVLQHVFVDFGLDPVHRVAHQTHALIGVKALDRLHEADVAFLDQVAVGQAVTQVLAGDGHHQAQVGHHQLTGSLDVVVIAQAARGALLLFEGEQRHAVDRRNVGVQVAQRGQRERPARPRAGHGQRGGWQSGGGKCSGHVVDPPQIGTFIYVSTLWD